MPPTFDAPQLHRILFERLHLPLDAHFVVAYSGGCDSHVLLHALAQLRCDASFRLSALHYDHAICAQSAQWARHCAGVCRGLGVPLQTARQMQVAPRGESVEAFARGARYRWFGECLHRGQILLTAHHLDDQAECLLLAAMRGGGVEMLAGIREQRALSANHPARVARPLLSFARDALRDYARRARLCWCEDPSNDDLRYERNFLRARVMPLLRQRRAGVVAALAQSAQHCFDAAEWLDDAVAPLLRECCAADKRGVFCLAPPLCLRKLRGLERAQLHRVLRAWLHRYGIRSPSARQWRAWFAQVFIADGAHAVLQCDDAMVRRFGGHLYLTRRLVAPPRAAIQWDLRNRVLDAQVQVEVAPASAARHDVRAVDVREVDVREVNVHDVNVHDVIDADGLRGRALHWVWRRGGERMTLPRRAHRSVLKKLQQQYAVPPWERAALPMLCADDEIVWAHRLGVGAGFGAVNADGVRIRLMARASLSASSRIS